MLVAFARHSRDGTFAVLRENTRSVAVMALGSVVGTAVGGLLVDVIPGAVLLPSSRSCLSPARSRSGSALAVVLTCPA